jgi:hypothetical protein
MFQDIYNYCISCIYNIEDIKDYEEKLLEKCTNNEEHFYLGKTLYEDEYIPPFGLSIEYKNNLNM